MITSWPHNRSPIVSVTVKVNHAPTAQNASFHVQKDGSVRIDFDCLVADQDDDALTLSLTNPSKGTLTQRPFVGLLLLVGRGSDPVQGKIGQNDPNGSPADGLVDGTLTGEFLEEFVLASRESIRAKFANQYSGDALYRKMLDEVLAKVDDTIASETSCFIAGTSVLTEAGEVPIESIKPGDMVLSRPEEGGELAYRPVVRTVKHSNKVIVAITYVDPNEPDAEIPTFATDNHPFWVEGRGWVAAGAVRPGYELQGTDGRKIVVSAVSPVHRTETPGVGWYQLAPNYDVLGNDVDFNGPTWRLVKSHTSRPYEEFVDGPLLGVDVYNFEVDGFHTYYVGPAGVWVHNADCAFKLSRYAR
ncbi:polymorphic toxin-type HINT domain-containing protein [Xanthomonas sp. NCPPB 2632]|uniref:polymorphic toxin-type HINT domain-containing protein n=1 Tax=Xanthomonas sp. NCPPB 2632 TaxID=3240912 RepID=UPI0035193524